MKNQCNNSEMCRTGLLSQSSQQCLGAQKSGDDAAVAAELELVPTHHRLVCPAKEIEVESIQLKAEDQARD
jgi:hypothetical protein